MSRSYRVIVLVGHTTVWLCRRDADPHRISGTHFIAKLVGACRKSILSIRATTRSVQRQAIARLPFPLIRQTVERPAPTLRLRSETNASVLVAIDGYAAIPHSCKGDLVTTGEGPVRGSV